MVHGECAKGKMENKKTAKRGMARGERTRRKSEKERRNGRKEIRTHGSLVLGRRVPSSLILSLMLKRRRRSTENGNCAHQSWLALATDAIDRSRRLLIRPLIARPSRRARTVRFASSDLCLSRL